MRPGRSLAHGVTLLTLLSVLVVPFGSHAFAARGGKKAAATPAAAAGPVDLNTASQAELEALPGVGAATAKKIIAGRPYGSVSDLSKAGVSAATVKKLGGLVTASGGMSAPAAAPAAARAPRASAAAASA